MTTETNRRDELPELPEPGFNTAAHYGPRIIGYTAQQMHEYARQCLAARPAGGEAVRIKTIARDVHYALCDDGFAPLSPTDNHKAREAIERVLTAALAQPAAQAGGDGAYYLQDSRSFVGNCPLWWCPEGRGYTTRVDEAWRMTKEQAEAQHRQRSTDVPWPCSVIDALRRPTIDMQDMRRAARQPAQSDGQEGRTNGL